MLPVWNSLVSVKRGVREEEGGVEVEEEEGEEKKGEARRSSSLRPEKRRVMLASSLSAWMAAWKERKGVMPIPPAMKRRFLLVRVRGDVGEEGASKMVKEPPTPR